MGGKAPIITEKGEVYYTRRNKNMQKLDNKKSQTYQMVLIALMAAITCILAPLSIQLPGGVPISLTNLVIYITVFILGSKKGTISYCIYLLIGLIGLPVFSGFTGGVGKLAGPTGGYLIGFIFLAIISGYCIERFEGKVYMYVAGMILGTAIAYALGTIWFMYQMKVSLVGALSSCVLPFLVGDGIKIIIATVVGPILKSSLKKANLCI